MTELMSGTHIVTKIIFYTGMTVILCDIIAAAFTAAYQKIIYPKMRKRYDESYAPRCSIVVPCKGIPKNFGNNLRGFLQLDYQDYEVIYVVESETDDAVPEIQKIIAEDSRAKFTVAGLATMNAQKCHNMLAALKLVRDDAEVFVFADSDIKPEKNWLREIVLPLQDPKVTVTTGFRWLLSQHGTIGELCHSYINIFIYTCFNAACYFGGVGLWGGTMAIKRKDYDALNVSDVWSRASVDDMSLSTLVLKNRKNAVLVPTCVTSSDDLLPTVGSSILWLERQAMYLKSYQRGLWVLTLPISIFGCALLCNIPIALIASALNPERTFAAMGGWGGVIFLLCHTLCAFIYLKIGKMPHFAKFLILQPFLRFMKMIAYLRTWTTRTITWAGIKYKLKYNGDVKTLTR